MVPKLKPFSTVGYNNREASVHVSSVYDARMQIISWILL